jgi:hypothetical protein
MKRSRGWVLLTRPANQKGGAIVSQDPTKKAANMGTHPNPGLDQQIRNRAYQLYEERGREDGHEIEDWLRAETGISRMVAKAAA